MESTSLYQAALGVNGEYRDAAADLRTAVRKVGEIQEEIAKTERAMAVIEAAAVVNATGSNESQRKAAAAVDLAANNAYREMEALVSGLRTGLAAQRGEVEYQEAQCRRLHAMLGLLSNAIVAAGPS